MNSPISKQILPLFFIQDISQIFSLIMMTWILIHNKDDSKHISLTIQWHSLIKKLCMAHYLSNETGTHIL